MLSYSQSSLPDIFKKTINMPIAPLKQGGPFSLYITQQHTQHHRLSTAGYAPGQRIGYRNSRQSRTVSMHSAAFKEPILRQTTQFRKSSYRGKSRASFQQQALMSGTVLLSRLPSNHANFPYQMSRRSAQPLVEMEEAESLKNRTQQGLQAAKLMNQEIQKLNTETNSIRHRFFQFAQDAQNQLNEFADSFTQQLANCYNNLSMIRRQTGKQLKANMASFDQLRIQVQMCQSFVKDLDAKSQTMYNQCLKTEQEKSPNTRESLRHLDFEEISSIPKSSRGATGELSRRAKARIQVTDQPNVRRSIGLVLESPKSKRMVLNGRQINLMNFDEN